MMQVRALAAAVFGALLMGCLGLLVRESGCSAQGCAFARFALGLVLVSFLALRGIVRRRSFNLQAVLSGVGIALCILFYFLAIERTTLGVAALLLPTGPLFASIGEAVVKHRCPSLQETLLLLTAACGIALVSCGGGGLSADPWGVVFGLLSGLSFGVYILFNRLIPEHIDVPERTFWQSAAGVAVLVVPMLSTDAPFAGLPEGLPYLLSIGLLQGFLVLMLVAFAMKHLPAIQYGALSYLDPATAVALGWAVYGEQMLPLQWVGVLLVLSSSLAQSLLTQREASLHCIIKCTTPKT
ncbi:MAG: EamA family transporter [Akkermansia muciniphila]|nr:EamA family transporter [Akkermansia muciniphila]